MCLITISVDRAALPPHTQAEFEEWVRYEVSIDKCMAVDNPMMALPIDAEVLEIG